MDDDTSTKLPLRVIERPYYDEAPSDKVVESNVLASKHQHHILGNVSRLKSVEETDFRPITVMVLVLVSHS